MGSNVQKTMISGYGSAAFQRNFDQQQSTLTMEWELEIENAKVEGGVSNDAEIAMEQAFLKFIVNAHQYFIAGLFTPWTNSSGLPAYLRKSKMTL
jgi:hypothetical protein